MPKPTPVVKRNKGSLYAIKGPSLFADKKDLHIGDIIQVKIDESLSSNTKNKRELSSDRTNSLGGGLLGATAGNTLGGVTSTVAKNVNPLLGVDFGTKVLLQTMGKQKQL